MKRYTTFVLALSIALNYVFSSWAEYNHPPQWRIREFHVPDVLSHEVVRSVVLKSPGEVWIATWGGGITVIRDMEASAITRGDGLIGNDYRDLLVDSWDGVWAAGANGISYIHGEVVTSYSLSDLGFDEDDSLYSISMDDQNRVWFSTGLSKLIYFEMNGIENHKPLGNWRKPDWELPGTSEFRKIQFDSNGNLWIANNHVGMMCVDKQGNYEIFSWVENDNWRPYIQDFTIDEKGRIWAVGANDLICIENQKIVLHKMFDFNLTSVHWYDDKMVIGSYQGFYLYEDNEMSLIKLSDQNPTPYIEFLAVFDDASLWVGTRLGAYRVSKNQWQLVEKLPNAFHVNPSAISKLTSGEIAVLDDGGYLSKWKNDNWETIGSGNVSYRRSGDPDKFYISDDSKAYFLSAYNNLYKISCPNVEENHVIELPDDFHYYDKGDMAYHQQYGLLVGIKNGLWRYRHDEWEQIQVAPDGKRQTVFSISSFDNGELWIGGLNWLRWKKDGDWNDLVLPQEYYDNESPIVDVAKYDGKLWIATDGNGLFYKEGENWRHYHHADGLPAESLSRLLTSSDGALWVGSKSHGVSSLKDGRWVRFGLKEGIPAGRIDSILEDIDGRIWISIRNAGIAYLEKNDDPPKVWMTSISERLLPQEQGIFSWQGRDLWHQTPNSDLVYSWRIVDENKSSIVTPWTPYETDTIVASPSIDPGEYRFEVHAQDKDRNETPVPASIAFVVTPYFWQTSQFQIPLLISFVCAFLFLLLWYFKHAALRRSERKYRALVEKDSISLVMNWDRYGKITYANKTAQDVLSFQQSASPRTAMEIMTKGNEYQHEFLTSQDRLFQKRQQAVECRLPSPTGAWIDWFFRAIQSKDSNQYEIQAIGIEITPLIQAEETLRQERLFFRQFCDSAQIGVMRMDEGGVVMYANPVMTNITGLTGGVRAEQPWNDKTAFRALIKNLHHSSEPSSQLLTGNNLNNEKRFDVMVLTHQIKNGFELMAIDYTRQKQLEEKLARASIEEQERLGSELHDGLCQQLTALSFLCSGLTASTNDAPPKHLVKEMSRLLEEAQQLARRLARGLNPISIKNRGLYNALQDLVESYRRVYPVKISLNRDLVSLQIDEEHYPQVYRIVREACFNALKHAEASLIVIQDVHSEGLCGLSIVDNGVGMNVKEIKRHVDGMGINLMYSCAELIGAKLDISSNENNGTTVSCTWPIR